MLMTVKAPNFVRGKLMKDIHHFVPAHQVTSEDPVVAQDRQEVGTILSL